MGVREREREGEKEREKDGREKEREYNTYIHTLLRKEKQFKTTLKTLA